MFIRVIVSSLLALTMSPMSQAEDVPTCANDAAQEFGVPPRIFQAMVTSEGWYLVKDEVRKRAVAGGHYGPMGLADHAIQEISQNIGTPEHALKEDACENFRGSAWWLMNPAGGAQEDDIWIAVRTYYYGHSERAIRGYPAVESARRIYEELPATVQ